MFTPREMWPAPTKHPTGAKLDFLEEDEQVRLRRLSLGLGTVEVVVALGLDTAYGIVNAIRSDAACRVTIEGPKRSRVVMEVLGLWHVAGGVRNAAMMVMGLGREDEAFIRYSCTGIAHFTQRVIFSEVLAGRLPKVQSALVRRRNVNGFEHKATGVAMKDGSDYVFDWWPTLTPGNPLISTLAKWVNGGPTVEYEQFREFS